jgi:hypothetical protein
MRQGNGVNQLRKAEFLILDFRYRIVDLIYGFALLSLFYFMINHQLSQLNQLNQLSQLKKLNHSINSINSFNAINNLGDQRG